MTPDLRAIITYEIRTIDKVSGKVVPEDEENVIEKVEYEPVEKDIPSSIEIPRSLRDFRDIDELEQWLGNIEVRDIGSGVTVKEINQDIKSFDCDDYALKLQEKALKDGYLMSFEIIHPSEYNELFKQGQIPDGTIHAINSVIIGNKVYYIEPKTHEIVFVACLD